MLGLLSLLFSSSMQMAAASAPKEPLGIRSNNPGNIVKSVIDWKGEVECEERGTGHECFESPEYGIRAMALVLKRYYYTYNLRTIEDIMARYSEFGGAAQGVSHISGLPRKAPLDFSSADTLTKLVHGIIVQENGRNPYRLETIREVIYDTYGANHFNRQHDLQRDTEVHRAEGSGKRGPAEVDDAEVRCGEGRACGNPCEQGRGIHVDPQGDRIDGSLLYHRPAKGRWFDRPDHSHYPRVDGVAERVLAVHRRQRSAYMAHRPWRGDNPLGHALSLRNSGAVFRRFVGWTSPLTGDCYGNY